MRVLMWASFRESALTRAAFFTSRLSLILPIVDSIRRFERRALASNRSVASRSAPSSPSPTARRRVRSSAASLAAWNARSITGMFFIISAARILAFEKSASSKAQFI